MGFKFAMNRDSPTLVEFSSSHTLGFRDLLLPSLLPLFLSLLVARNAPWLNFCCAFGMVAEIALLAVLSFKVKEGGCIFFVSLEPKFFFKKKTESLTVIQEFGVQIVTTRMNGLKRRIFIERDQIDSLIINEGISFPDVVTYLAFVVKGKEKLLLPFQVFFGSLVVF